MSITHTPFINGKQRVIRLKASRCPFSFSRIYTYRLCAMRMPVSVAIWDSFELVP